MPTRQNRKNRKHCNPLSSEIGSHECNKEQTDTVVTISNINNVSDHPNDNSTQTEQHSECNNLHTAEITVETLQQTATQMQMSEYGYPMITFTSGLKNHIITVELDVGRKQALINNMDIGNCAPVELTLLLKKIDVELKKIGITTIVQQVTPSDWENVLNPLKLFRLVNYNSTNNFMTIICPIDRFPEAVMKSLGFDNHDNTS
jgi:hypothetical protein